MKHSEKSYNRMSKMSHQSPDVTIYEWAGQSRKIRTAKGGNWFCYPEYIDREMEKIFAELATEEHLSMIVDIKTFTDRASYYISEINAIHSVKGMAAVS